MKICFSVFVLMLSAISTVVSAQDVNCTNPQSQFEMNECSYRDWQTADDELNRVWKIVFRAMKRRDAELPKELRGAAKALLNGQRGWINYRDGQCDAERSEVAGGTMAPLVGSSCMTRLTELRTKELQAMVRDR